MKSKYVTSITTVVAIAALVALAFVINSEMDNTKTSFSTTTSTSSTTNIQSLDSLVPLSDLTKGRRKPISWLSAKVIDEGRQVEVKYQGGVPECYPVDVDIVRASNTSATIFLFEGEDFADKTCLALSSQYIVRAPVNPAISLDAMLIDGHSDVAPSTRHGVG